MCRYSKDKNSKTNKIVIHIKRHTIEFSFTHKKILLSFFYIFKAVLGLIEIHF